jgi:N-acetylglucosaminyl-diphospho-decaprenol L-rhamnosyltransferase
VDARSGDSGTDARVAVVIVTYNSADVLRDCLASLADQSVDLVDVVVVDNASSDKTVAIAAESTAPPVRVIDMGRNAGYAAAINAGIAVLDISELDAVLVLNPDCRLASGALRILARALRPPGRGIAVPLLVNPDGSLQPSIRRSPTVARALAEALLGGIAGRLRGVGELVTDPRIHSRPGRVAWATGAALLISAAAIVQTGPLDESYLLYSEETEYLLRAADGGWITWFEPAAVIEHIAGNGQATNPVLASLAVVNRVKLFRSRHNRVHAAAFFAAVTIGEGIRALAGRRTSRASFVALVRPSRRVRELAT